MEALAEKSCSAVQVLAAERETPPDPVIHVPSTAKQPSSISMPRAKVLVAEVEVMSRAVAWMPPENVEVPVPETASDVAETLVPEMEPPVMVESASVIASRRSIRDALATAAKLLCICEVLAELWAETLKNSEASFASNSLRRAFKYSSVIPPAAETMR
ncbi:MAG: hypothetical protein UY04_C0064G0006 [Parcubacteria group bacterium GW2011_GWA2_47_7]|nr:MAG: hypothetical protein UY04_C0064G0006 [Parcubacteria group bacterium GW2011_GWA2_47_7]